MKLVPKKYKGEGLHTYCNACKRQITDKCPLTQNSVKKCENKDKWRYKIVKHIPQPGGPGKKRTKICDSQTLEGALQELYSFKGSSSRNSENRIGTKRSLKEGIEVFFKKKFGEAEFKHQSKSLTKDHKEDIVRVLKRFSDSLRNSGKNPDKMYLSDLDDTVLGPFYLHLEQFIESNSARDRHTRIMRNFLSFLQNRGMYTGANFFKTVDTEEISGSPVSVTDEEFEKVLAVITEENSVGRKGKNRLKKYYRQWLPLIFRMARLTGVRKEELYNLKWSDIYTHKKGDEKFELLIVHNLKVERLKNRDDIVKVIPVTDSIKELLQEAKDSGLTSEKLIETTLSYKAFKDFIGRAFTHFYKIAFPEQEEHKVFKQLRKSQMSDISGMLGEEAHKLTGHSGKQILEKHYVDKIQAAIKFLEIEQKRRK